MGNFQETIDNAKPLTEADLDPVATAKDIIEKAIKCASDNDPGAPFEAEVIEALRVVRNADYQRYRSQFKRACKDILVAELDKAVKGASDEGAEQESIADVLVAMVRESAELFHDADGNGYASFERDGHRETWLLGSKGFREWASFRFYEEVGKAPREASLKDALATLSGIAKFDGEERQVWLRTAKLDDRYFIDLCNGDWQAVEITAIGFQVLDNPPVKFLRTGAMGSLPIPGKVVDLSLLWKSINVSPLDQPFVLAWVLESFRPDTPFPVLELGGEQGSGKSDTQNRLRDLIDPSGVNLRAGPKTVEDVFVGAANNWLNSYNNLSHLTSNQQDALCTLATGGGFACRTLYTNLDETLVEVTRPVVMNGISTLATAQDLIDRVVRIELPLIQERRQAAELKHEFEENKPRIFGGLLELFRQSLAVLASTQVDKLPRMADFAVLGEAMYRALGRKDSFVTAYKHRRDQAVIAALESSPVVCAVQSYIEANPNGGNKTLKEWLNILAHFRENTEAWPKSAKGLGDKLRRYAPGLRVAGIEVKFDGVRRMDGYHVIMKEIVETDTSFTPLGKKTEINVHKVHEVHEQTILTPNDPLISSPYELHERYEHQNTVFTTPPGKESTGWRRCSC